MRKSAKDEQILSPAAPHPKYFSKAADAVAELQLLYQAATKFLYDAFSEALKAPRENTRYRAFYPEIRITTQTASFTQSDVFQGLDQSR